MDMTDPRPVKVYSDLENKSLLTGFKLIATAKEMAELYEANFKVVSKYVHATSRGHEAIQVATGMLLQPQDYVAPYYRDDAMLLAIGMRPFDLMLQVLAKRDDPFSGGRTYYAHPSLNDIDKPKIPHQSSATGMQAIPITGVAMGIQYKEKQDLASPEEKTAVVVCSIGDAAMTEGEVSEALQMAALHQYPIIYLVQDNGWDISATREETRAMNAYEFAQGFPGIEAITIDGSDFVTSYHTMQEVIDKVRTERRPFLVHASVPLLNHHTSGVRMEFYRDDLEEHKERDPYHKIKNNLITTGITAEEINAIEEDIRLRVKEDYERAVAAEDPRPEDLYTHIFAETPVTEEQGTRSPEGGEEKVMVDCALLAVQEIMQDHPESLLYGQDVGGRLGGVFREAATLAQKFGESRVFNTPIQEAYIVGSTVGMSAVGLKPIVEVQFADYIWPGLNQLFTEVSRSNYLSNGKWPVSMVLRVPIGAYGSGGPYHSSSVESILTNIHGIKIIYPSNGADMKGLIKAAYYDPNPVVVFEHKGLYWSKVKGTENARSVLPDRDYIIPIGKGNMIQEADETEQEQGDSVLVISYGMGVHWAWNASKDLRKHVGILDLRSLAPLDWDLILAKAKSYNKILVVTEEPSNNGFAQSIAARIQQEVFEYLDAPVNVIGAENTPAIPLNETLEQTMIPSAEKVSVAIERLLKY